jgi:glucosamine 6-phosphate synthetase-like amidotransferase/phosphosugar isomerase protein
MGPITDRLDDVESLNTRCIVGHSRLATTGTYAGGEPKIGDTMPFQVGEVAVVHNGNVRDYVRIAREWGIELDSGCDSEVIAHILDRHRSVASDLHEALEATIQAVDDGRPFALIAITADGEIAGAHRELPLYVANADEGTYFCSRRPMIEGATVVMAPPIWSWPRAIANQDVA